MKNYRIIQKERKSRKKGLWYSIGVHSVLFALLLLPFFHKQDEEVRYEEVVVVDFSSGSSMMGASSSASPSQAEKKDVKKRTSPIKSLESSPSKDVLTQEKSEIDIPELEVKTPPKRVPPEFNKAPGKLESSSHEVEVSTTSEPVNLPELEPVPVPSTGSAGGSSVGNRDLAANAGTGESSAIEDGGKGNGKSGKGSSDTGLGEDNSGSGLFGNIGELSRPVIYRPDISKMIRENSVVKVRLCINRSGNVIRYAFEPDGSNVRDKSLIKATMNIVSDYRFKPVVGGPYLECGIYTIRVDMNN